MNVHWYHTQLKVSYYTIFTLDPEEPKRSAPKQLGESELGQYVDRLLAKAIVAIAKTYNAGSIAVPKLGNIREIVEAEIKAKAEEKCSGFVEAIPGNCSPLELWQVN
jgi:hypothetical protein